MKRLFLALAALLALTAGAAEAATPPRGAFTYVGNVDDGSRSGVVDARRLGSSAVSRVNTALDSGDDMTVGDVLGDGFDEVVVADDGEGRIDIHDTSAKTTTSFDTTIGFNVNLYTDRGDDITTGNIVGDAKDEVIVASTRFKLIVVYSATGEELRRLSNKGFEDGDRVLAGDFLPGRDYDEIAIISNEDEGRIDIFNGDAEHLAQRHSAYDGDGDDVAAGDVTGDLAEDVIVANDEEGRIDRVQIVNDTADDRDSAYDGDDRLGVGDMTGDGIAEVVIANTEQNRIDVINYHGAGGNFSSAYDGDDRFAVGTFGSGDLDGDSIPDRVELLGVRDDKGDVLLDLAERGASPCRKDVVVDIARMDGIDPLEEALTNVVDTFAAAAEVVPVADCPYAGASKATGMNLIVLETDPAQMRVIPHQKTINGPEAVNALIESTFSLDAPFIRRVLWADDYEIVSKPGTADEIRSSPAGHAGRGKHKLDMVIALDDDKDSTGVDLTSDRRLQVQESTFMHELGHALGLSHGGRVNANCKPNHLSLMNYAFRTGVPKANGDFVIDYSHVELATLDEEHLDERAGIGGSGDFKTAWTNGKGVRDEGDADARLDWDGVDSDGNGVSDDDNGDDGEGVAVDLNVNDPLSASAIPCTNPNGDQVGLQKLTSHNDWAFLNTKLRAPGEEQSSDEEAASEPTVASLVTALENRDQVFFPDQAVRLRPARAGFRDDVLGVAFDANHVYAVHNSRSSATGAIDGKGSLAVLDRKTLTVQSQIAVGLDARAVAVNPVTSRAYVVNRGTGTGSTLSVVNTATRKVISEIKLGQIAADVAVNTKLNRVYISNPGQEDIQVLNGANNALLAPVQVGKGLGGLAVDEVTGTIYVTMSSRGAGNEFAKLGRVRDNGATRSVLPSIDLGDPGTQPVDVAFDSKRGRLFVAGLGGGSISPSVIVLGAALGIELARIPVANPLRAISLNADTGLAFAAGDRGVEVVDENALRVVRHIDAGIAFSVGTPNGHQVYSGGFLDGTLRRLASSGGEPR